MAKIKKPKTNLKNDRQVVYRFSDGLVSKLQKASKQFSIPQVKIVELALKEYLPRLETLFKSL